MQMKIKLTVTSILVVWSITLAAAQSTINRTSPHSGLRDPRLAPGKLIAEGRNTNPVGPLKLLTYRLEEVQLSEPAGRDSQDDKDRFRTAFRLTITSEVAQGSRVIWIDDFRAPEVWEAGVKSVATIIYDRSVIRDGAVISVGRGGELHDLPERLTLPRSFIATEELERVEEGNKIVSIRSGLKIAGSERQPIVLVEMSTATPLPVVNSSFLAQIGRKFFGRLSGQGRRWVLELTDKEFAALKNGDRVAIGIGIVNIAYLGRLNKSMLDR